ncbi:hypothetical protein Pfo_026947 [Paulownia fortunei]|nr:hypothetical protein Pfo_026947 [Paulownia fortunei]
MKVDAVSKKLVKPCTPTPDNQKNYKISFMDELNPTMNVVGIFYYQPGATMNEKLNQLEESLAEILPQFYPFAGRYMKNDHLVDCSDQGAQLIEANVDVELLQLINPESKVKPEQLNDLLPCEIGAADEETDPILSIQINKFRCGGIAIGICISHRIVDACSLGTFISAWSNASRGDNREGICPSFDGPVFFPGKNFPTPEFGTTRDRDNGLYDIVAKRFTFDKNAIASMRERVETTKKTGELRQPSRVQVVSGLIIKAIAGVDQARYGQSKALLVAQAVNIRERTVPALSKHCCGNLAALAITECTAGETKNMGFQDFVRVLGDDAKKTVNDCTRILSEGEDGRMFLIDTSVYASEKSLRPDVNVVWVTDWSKFRFYEADFGWGKPVWASVANVVIKNHVLLMNTKEGDGIEAWVQLQETDMAYFEQEMNHLANQ